MQKIDPPAGGDHNPNSYTAEEILAALKGSTGTRRFSFRYEHLDENNDKVADLVTVKSAKIDQNWLADIKRTASFTLTTGPDDNIDYLKDRIKPWVRLHMPPKAIPRVSTEEPPIVYNAPNFGAMTDNFSTGTPKNIWSSYANGAINTGGYLTLPNTGASGPRALSNSVWSLTGAQVAAELNTVPYISGGPTALTRLQIGSVVAGSGLAVQYNQGASNLAFMSLTGNNDTSPVTAAYNSTDHKWVRIRENNGSIFWETSATGLPGTWTIQRLAARPSWVVSANNALNASISSSADLTPGLNYADNFGRAVTGSWGTNAETGYTYSGIGANLTNWHVAASGVGRFNLTATPAATRHQVTANATQHIGNIDQRVTILPLGGVTTGASLMPGLTARYTSVTDFYTARVHFHTGGTLFASIWRGQGGQQSNSVDLGLAYNSTTEVHLRMQVEGQTIRAKVWINSTPEPSSWTLERTISDTPIDIGRYGVFMGGFSGNTNTNYNMGYKNYRATHLTAEDFTNTPARWDNLNLTPQGTSTAFMPQVEWTNTFNGTPGVTGEAITPNNSSRHGNAVDAIAGSVFYSDGFTVDSKKSAKLGSDDMTTDGEIAVRIPNPISEWSYRMYYKVPTGGSLFLTADSAEIDATNDVVLDSASGTVVLGTIIPPAFIRAQLINQPVKLEIIAEATLTTYRAFWTNVNSTSPDYVATESNVGRQGLTGFTLRGGGSSTPPVYVDNVTLAEPAIQEKFTADAVNYVEWPQGVFLLSSPARKSDESDVVTREIQGYDLAQILADDKVSDRFSTEGIIRASDNFTRFVSGSWGTGSDGTVWLQNVVANTTPGVSLSGYSYMTLLGNTGTIRLQQAGNTNRQVLIDSEVYVRMCPDQIATGGAILGGAVFRIWTTSDYYRLRVEFDLLGALWMSVTRTAVQYGNAVQAPFNYVAGTFINVRAQCIGHVVRGKVWADGTKEPANWMIEEEIDLVSDQIAYGYTGVSASAFPANTNVNPQMRYDLFELNPNPANTYTGVVEAILADLLMPRRLTQSTTILPTIREWPAGTTKRQIINDLLNAINYESISFDEEGYAVVKPYISPQQRSEEFEYRDDALSILYPEMMHELDLFKIPNRWVLTMSDPDRDPLTVVFTNADPSSPTSTVRRGRTITDFLNNVDASDEATMIQKASRLAFEASQVYEAVEFTSGLNPLHSGNDVLRLEYDPLGLNAKYTEHSWAMSLDAGASMSHRVRRVIPLDIEQDPSLLDDDLKVTGALEAGNMAWGILSITPVANRPTRGLVTGLNLQGRGPVRAFVCASTSVPGSTFMECSVANVTATGFEIWVYRTNTTVTNMHWFAIRGA